MIFHQKSGRWGSVQEILPRAGPPHGVVSAGRLLPSPEWLVCNHGPRRPKAASPTRGPRSCDYRSMALAWIHAKDSGSFPRSCHGTAPGGGLGAGSPGERTGAPGGRPDARAMSDASAIEAGSVPYLPRWQLLWPHRLVRRSPRPPRRPASAAAARPLPAPRRQARERSRRWRG